MWNENENLSKIQLKITTDEDNIYNRYLSFQEILRNIITHRISSDFNGCSCLSDYQYNYLYSADFIDMLKQDRLSFIVPIYNELLSSRNFLKNVNKNISPNSQNLLNYMNGIKFDYKLNLYQCVNFSEKDKIKQQIEYLNEFVKNIYLNILTKYFNTNILTQNEINNIKNIEIYTLFDKFKDKSIFIDNQDLYSQPFYRLQFIVETKIKTSKSEKDNSYKIQVYVFPFLQKIFIPILNVFDFKQYKKDNKYDYLPNLEVKYYCAKYNNIDEIYDLIKSYLCITVDQLYLLTIGTIVKNPLKIENIEIGKITSGFYVYLGNIINQSKIIKVIFNNNKNRVFIITCHMISEMSTVDMLLRIFGLNELYTKQRSYMINQCIIEYENARTKYDKIKMNNIALFKSSCEEKINECRIKFGKIFKEIIDSLLYNNKLKNEIDYNKVDIDIRDCSYFNKKINLLNKEYEVYVQFYMNSYYGTQDKLISFIFLYNDDNDKFQIENTYINKSFTSVTITQLKNKKIIDKQSDIIQTINIIINSISNKIECENIFKNEVMNYINEYKNYIQSNSILKEEIDKILDSFQKNNKNLINKKFFENLSEMSNNIDIRNFEDIESFFDRVDYYLGVQFNVIRNA